MRRTFVVPTSIALTMLSVAPAAAQFGERTSTRTQGSARVQGGGWTRVAGFNVVLVLASQQTDLSSDGIPSSATKALADLKDFLPYRSYKLLDTQWSVGSTQLTRLRGLANVEYSLAMDTSENIPARVTVSRFLLQDAGVAATAAAAGVGDAGVSLITEKRGELVRRLALMRKGLVASSPTKINNLEVQIEALSERERDPRPQSDGPIINTSFTMDVGETVVVGTSRVQGDKALIVLLTAVPKK